ncbi:hypothetical protein O181_077507, partial [Austropuccinia psidii MF-1]|nr:hypothetical protein [Austropuccinia psidii MF-1]
LLRNLEKRKKPTNAFIFDIRSQVLSKKPGSQVLISIYPDKSRVFRRNVLLMAALKRLADCRMQMAIYPYSACLYHIAPKPTNTTGGTWNCILMPNYLAILSQVGIKNIEGACQRLKGETSHFWGDLFGKHVDFFRHTFGTYSCRSRSLSGCARQNGIANAASRSALWKG